MEINDFIQKFAADFEMTSIDEITPTTVFKDLDEWDSLMSLGIIGMIKNNYNVKITGSEIRDVNTVEELFNLVASKKE